MNSCLTFLLFSMISMDPRGGYHPNERPAICDSSMLREGITYNDLIRGLPSKLVSALAERPDSQGALGRNRDGYIHVRFQLQMSRLSDYAFKFESKEALTEYLKTLEYSFDYQKAEGDFEFIPPRHLMGSLEYRPPSKANLASGTAFFAYGLGIGLHGLYQSDWYLNSPAVTRERSEIESLTPGINSMLAYLKRQVNLLYQVDAKASNRLLFNALAFYSIGLHLEDEEAKGIGISFMEKALTQTDAEAGYFVENNGWDSSYNGVAAKLCLELYAMLEDSKEHSRNEKLAEAAIGAVDWQTSRILNTGEISTEGNTRVFPGGETFLGKEKGVDVIKTVKAFFYMDALCGDKKYGALARRTIGYYR